MKQVYILFLLLISVNVHAEGYINSDYTTPDCWDKTAREYSAVNSIRIDKDDVDEEIALRANDLFTIAENTLPFIEENNAVLRIVVLGSSTAEGIGPNNIEDSWVPRYEEYLKQLDVRFEIINLARGGYSTYDILPTGTSIPENVTRSIDTERNVTKALSYNPNAIIINMPSNDAAYGYPVEDQIDNYNIISSAIEEQNIPLWVTTPQPRRMQSEEKKNIQLDMIDVTYDLFGDRTLDFWTGLGQDNDNGILPEYDAGDHIHLNAAGHQILLDRLIAAEIGEEVINLGVNAADMPFVDKRISIFPNPVRTTSTIQFSNSTSTEAEWILYNALGNKVLSGKSEVNSGKMNWSRGSIPSGMYLLKILQNEKINVERLLIK